MQIGVYRRCVLKFCRLGWFLGCRTLPDALWLDFVHLCVSGISVVNHDVWTIQTMLKITRWSELYMYSTCTVHVQCGHISRWSSYKFILNVPGILLNYVWTCNVWLCLCWILLLYSAKNKMVCVLTVSIIRCRAIVSVSFSVIFWPTHWKS